MKAVVFDAFGDVDVLNVREMPDPVPGEGEVLVRIHAAAVNPVDWKVRKGFLQGFINSVFPAIPGWDMAGTVVSCGHAARRFRPGDAVFAYARRPVIQHGTYAELIALPEAYLAHKPVNLRWEEAAGVPLAGLTAWQCLFTAAGLRTGQRVLVLGASGGVGGFAVQLARMHGAEVAGVASARNAQHLEQLGVHHVLDYADASWPQVLQRATAGGVDLLVDCIGGDTLKAAVPTVRSGGTVVSITDRNAGALWPAEHARFQYVFVEPHSRDLDGLRAAIEAGHVKTRVAEVFPLERAREAHAMSEKLHTAGKIALRTA